MLSNDGPDRRAQNKICHCTRVRYIEANEHKGGTDKKMCEKKTLASNV